MAPPFTVAPRPSWHDLAAAAFGATPEAAARPWTGGEGARIFLLSRAAWGFAAAATALSRSLGRPARIWFPGHFCNASLGPVRKAVAELRFYPVTADAAPDWPACRALTKRERQPDAFVLVHPFGWANDGAAAEAFAAESGALLIEDGAHAFLPDERIGRRGGLVVYSPYKMLPVPDGGVVVVRPGPFHDRLAAACGELGGTRANAMPWLARRLIERVVPARLLAPLTARRGQTDFDADPPPAGEAPDAPQASMAATRMLARFDGRLETIAARRRRNAQCLAGLPWPPGCRPFRQKSADLPYRFVLRCESRERAVGLFKALRARGVPAESWPDLPPEVTADPARHAAALALRGTLLLIPVHQDFEPAMLEAVLRDL